MKVRFQDGIPYDEYGRYLSSTCDNMYRNVISLICDYFNDVCGFHVAVKISSPPYVDNLFIFVDDANIDKFKNYTFTIENNEIVDVHVNTNRCYVIKLENTRYNDEEILYDEGVFESKEDAVLRINEMAQLLCKEKNMIVRNVSDSDSVEDFEILVTYESCKQCPMYEEDYPCIGECYADHYRFGLVEYVLHKKGE